MSDTVEIATLGHAGHGATVDGQFVPLTVPGDVVTVAVEAGRLRLKEVVVPGPSRVNPVCRHFGQCGGCALQMMEQGAYLQWKQSLIVTALRHRGFSNPPVDAIRTVPAQTRRRAGLKCQRIGARVAVGFYEADSHRLVDIDECPVLTPALARLLPRLKQGLASILRSGEEADLHTTDTESGIDLSLTLRRDRTPDFLMQLSGLAAELAVARLCWNGEPVVVNSTPLARIGAVEIALPPEAFLQPSREGEVILRELVAGSFPGGGRVADLFSGCGTFSFALRRDSGVTAFDNSPAQIAALNDAAKRAGANVKGQVRDLFRCPLSAGELREFNAVVLDPPRPGALAQSRQLAASGVKSVFYVSCNPASFARDARILCDGGFSLVRIVPIDQFRWSPHVELFAQLTR